MRLPRSSTVGLSPVLVLLALACLTVAGCGGPPKWSLVADENEPACLPNDQQPLTHEPKERDPSLYWDAVNQSSFYLIENTLDLPRQYRKLFDQRKEAYNADVFGRVSNSSWFTNRHGIERMSADELRRGPQTIAGPDTSGPWTIIRAKTQGVTPGFFIRDPSDETFILKFDPAAHPELATGAEMVSTMFFYAVGYNVPENYLVTFDPSQLRIEEGLQFKDRRGAKRPFTQEVLDEVLAKVARQPDGRIRAVASRFLPGKPLGPFSYHGRRKDDPNDYIPHQHRRELRGLKVFASLVNHFDTKDLNSLDVLVEDDGARYVKHYLIDFGSTLGSDGDEPKAAYKGYAYVFDLEQALVSLVTLGLRRWSWEGASAEGMLPSIGYFESKRFTPAGWKPLHANPAFGNMTANDGYWATRIVAAFSQDDLRACVQAGEYTDPAAEDYLVQTLMERRRKIIEYYYDKVNPLDDFHLSSDDCSLTVSFVDRWVVDGVGPADQVEYRYRFGRETSTWGAYQELDGKRPIIIDSDTLERMDELAATADRDEERVFNVQIQARRRGEWGHWVRVYIYYDGTPYNARLVGVERDS